MVFNKIFVIIVLTSIAFAFEDGKTYIIKSILRDWTLDISDGSAQEYIPVVLGELGKSDSDRWTARRVNLSYTQPSFLLENAKQEPGDHLVLDYNTCKSYLWIHDVVDKAAYQHWYIEKTCVNGSYLIHTTYEGGKDCLTYTAIPKSFEIGKCDRENINQHWRLIEA